MKQETYLGWILAVSIISVALSVVAIAINLSLSSKLDSITSTTKNNEESLNTLSKSTLSPMDIGGELTDEERKSSLYLRVGNLENLLYQVCYGDAFYGFGRDVVIKSNERCPAI